MTTLGCQRHGHLNCTRCADDRVLFALRDELASLKAEHARLREAADEMHHAAMHGTISRRTCDQLRAALDKSTTTCPERVETFDPAAVRELLEIATHAACTPASKDRHPDLIVAVLRVRDSEKKP